MGNREDPGGCIADDGGRGGDERGRGIPLSFLYKEKNQRVMLCRRL